MLRYSTDAANTFIRHATELGYEVRHYRGRSFYRGPAVTVERDGLSAFLERVGTVCQWDNLGRDWVVHPERSAEIVADPNEFPVHFAGEEGWEGTWRVTTDGPDGMALLTIRVPVDRNPESLVGLLADLKACGLAMLTTSVSEDERLGEEA